MNYVALGKVIDVRFPTFTDLFKNECEYKMRVHSGFDIKIKCKYMKNVKRGEIIVVVIDREYNKVVEIFKVNDFLDYIHKIIFSNYKKELFYCFNEYVKNRKTRLLNIILNNIGSELILHESINKILEEVNVLEYCKKYNKNLYLEFLRR